MAAQKIKQSIVSLTSALGLWTGGASAEMGLNFPEPAATSAQEIYDIHMLTTTISTQRQGLPSGPKLPQDLVR